MSFASLLNQSGTISGTTGMDAYGKAAYTGSTSVRCRFEYTKSSMINAQRETEPIDAIVFVPADTVVLVGDRFTFDAQNYRVMKLSRMVDGRGLTRHIELLLKLWV